MSRDWIRKLTALLAIRGDPWVLAGAAAVALLAVRNGARGLFDSATLISGFRDRAIGETTLAAIDASGYARTYALLVVLGGTAFVVAVPVLDLLGRYWRARLRGRALVPDLHCLHVLLLFVDLLLVLSVIARSNQPLLLAYLLSGVAILLAGALTLKAWLHHQDSQVGSPRRLRGVLDDRSLRLLSLSLPLPLLFAWGLISGRFRFFPVGWLGNLLLFLLVTVVLFALLAILSSPRRRSAVGDGRVARRRWRRRLAAAAAPLLLLPAAVVAANEIQFAYPRWSVRALALVLTVLLVLIACGLFWYFGRARRLPRSETLARYVYFPLILATLALLIDHRHQHHLGSLDYFHLGERTLPTHQLFRFGTIPLIDLRLAHTLSDMVYQSLYSLLNGLRDFDMLLWQRWMPGIVVAVLSYLLLARITRPFFALLFVIATPVTSLVTTYFAPALLAALLLGRALRRPTAARLAWVWIGCLGLALWRIDFGLAGAASTLLLLVLRFARRQPPPWRALLRSLVAPAAALASLLVVTSLLAQRPTFEMLAALVRSYTFRLGTRTRPQIIEDYDLLAALQYYLLPALAVIVVLAAVHRRLLTARRGGAAVDLLAWIGAFSLAMSVRSLERHSLVEGFNSYLFFLLLVLAPVLVAALWRPRLRAAAQVGVLLLMLLRVVLLLPPSGAALGSHYRPGLLPPHELFQIHEWRGDERRVTFDEEQHRQLLQFLSRQLAESETFYDFTSSPLLYVLADRQFPVYVIPNLVQTGEATQRLILEDLEHWRSSGRLPLVLFKQGSYWDAMDGVATEVRSYRIAEWFYRHYRPLVRIDPRYEVWHTRDREPRSELDTGTFRLPFRDGLVGHDLTMLGRTRTTGLSMVAGGNDPHLYRFVRVGRAPSFDRHSEWRLVVDGRSSLPGRVQLFYQLDGEDFTDRHSAHLEVTTPGEWELWSMPIRDPEGALTDVRFDPPDGAQVEIRHVFLEGRTPAIKPLDDLDIRQRFDLRYLPLVWANLDPLQALQRSPEQAVLLGQEQVLEPGKPLTLALAGEIDRSRGNYLHLRLRRAPSPPDESSQPSTDDGGPGAENGGQEAENGGQEAEGGGQEAENGGEEGHLRIWLGEEDCCSFRLAVAPGVGPEALFRDYLVRLSTQWRWATLPPPSIRLEALAPVEVERVAILAGD